MAYVVLIGAVVRVEGGASVIAGAIGRDRKEKLSIVLCLVAIVCAFVAHWLSRLLYPVVALMWLIRTAASCARSQCAWTPPQPARGE